MENMPDTFSINLASITPTSFPGFSPTRPTERVGENPGNEVAITRVYKYLRTSDFIMFLEIKSANIHKKTFF